jgi:hypothetical protein
LTRMTSIRASLNGSIFWVITPCSLPKINQGVKQVASTAQCYIPENKLFITTAVRTSDPTWASCSFSIWNQNGGIQHDSTSAGIHSATQLYLPA